MLYLYSQDQQDVYFRSLQEALPDWKIACWPSETDAERVTHVAAWGPPPMFFSRFPNLRVVFTLGAGVEQLLLRTDLPDTVQIIRLTNAGMAQQMTEYCLYGLLHYQREMNFYRQQQEMKQWSPRNARLAKKIRVSVLGLGELGGKVACELSRLGYSIRGWSRQARQIDGVVCLYGDAALDAMLTETDVLLCVLPSTPKTQNLLDARRLALMPEGSALINAGRGSLIDEAALLACLNRGGLSFALLDVFAKEPLPENHPFWQHPRVIITPHVAADTVPDEAVAQIVANLHRLSQGLSVTGLVDRQRGY